MTGSSLSGARLRVDQELPLGTGLLLWTVLCPSSNLNVKVLTNPLCHTVWFWAFRWYLRLKEVMTRCAQD